MNHESGFSTMIRLSHHITKSIKAATQMHSALIICPQLKNKSNFSNFRKFGGLEVVFQITKADVKTSKMLIIKDHLRASFKEPLHR